MTASPNIRPGRTQSTSPTLRIAYLSGPSRADRVYEDVIESRPATYFGTDYMRQFLLLVLDLKAEALVETWHGQGSYCLRKGPFVFNNVPEPQSKGVRYHLGQIRRQLGVLWRFFRYRPDIVVLTGKQEYWWVLAPMRLTGAKWVASFHGLLWRRFGTLKRHERFLLSLNRKLALKHLDAVVSTSQLISEQFADAAGPASGKIPLFAHLPTYDEQQFADIVPTERLEANPFHVAFTGRIEADKGVFDLLDMAAHLQEERPGEFQFHLCGDGSELGRLCDTVRERHLANTVHVHGYCAPGALKAVLSQCHAVVVPTRTECPAGFEMTCAEAILSWRPLVTSDVCPALEYLRPASIEVPPDDVAQYKQALVELKDNRALYRERRDAAGPLRAQFFDPKNSWDVAMRQALAGLLPESARGGPSGALQVVR